MRQLVFKDNSRVLTTTDNGKILFPHHDMGDISYDPINVIDNFEIKYEKEKYGFFMGKCLNLQLPSSNNLANYYERVFELCKSSSVYKTDKCYIVENGYENTVITEDIDTGELIIDSQSKIIQLEEEGKFNARYFAIHNSTANNRSYIEQDDFKFSIIKHIVAENKYSQLDFGKIGMRVIMIVHQSLHSVTDILYTDKGVFIKNKYSSYATFVTTINGAVACFSCKHGDMFILNIKSVKQAIYQNAVNVLLELGYGPNLGPASCNTTDHPDWEGYKEVIDNKSLLTISWAGGVILFNVDKMDEINDLDADVSTKILEFIDRSKKESESYLKDIIKSGNRNMDIIRKNNYKSTFILPTIV